MSTGYQITDQEGIYYLTFQVVNWIDLFTRKIYRDIIVESLQFSIQHKKPDVFAFVIMSNHVHLIVQSGIGSLIDAIRDVKRHDYRQSCIISALCEEDPSLRSG